MTAGRWIGARTASLLDTSAITRAAAAAERADAAVGAQHGFIPTIRIHPEDVTELRGAWRYCWPGNDRPDRWDGVKLIEDDQAPRLPRKPL
jgi:hypothetical protein